MVVNLASSGTAVNPIGLPSLAFKPEVNLSTSCTVVGSWGLKNAGGEIQFFLGHILKGGGGEGKRKTHISLVISLRAISKSQPGMEPSLLFLRASM